MSLFDQEVVRLRGTPELDPYSGEATSIDWTNPDRLPIPAANVQPELGAEETFDRQTVVTRWRLFADGHPDLEPTDRVEFEGEEYDIDGEVMRWSGGDLGHTVALLKRVSVGG